MASGSLLTGMRIGDFHGSLGPEPRPFDRMVSTDLLELG